MIYRFIGNIFKWFSNGVAICIVPGIKQIKLITKVYFFPILAITDCLCLQFSRVGVRKICWWAKSIKINFFVVSLFHWFLNLFKKVKFSIMLIQ